MSAFGNGLTRVREATATVNPAAWWLAGIALGVLVGVASMGWALLAAPYVAAAWDFLMAMNGQILVGAGLALLVALALIAFGPRS